MEDKVSFEGIDYTIQYTDRTKIGIIFLHGFCFDHSIWGSIMPYFENFSTITFDHSGMGNSGIHKNHSIDLMAKLVKKVIEHFDYEQYYIIGHSMGGYIASNLAIQFSEKITGITLLNSHAFDDSIEKKESRMKSIQFVENNGVKPFVKQMIPALFSQEFAQKNPMVIENLIHKAAKYSQQGIIACQNAMISRIDSSACFKQKYINWQIIYGKLDQTVPVELNLKQALLPDEVDIECLKNTAHVSMLEEPNVMSEAILNFINQTKH